MTDMAEHVWPIRPYGCSKPIAASIHRFSQGRFLRYEPSKEAAVQHQHEALLLCTFLNPANPVGWAMGRKQNFQIHWLNKS